MPTVPAAPSNVQKEPIGKIVRDVLIAAKTIGVQPIGTLPTDDTAWPIYFANLPDSPDDCIAVFGTTPIYQGRYMTNGAYQKRPAFNIQIRANDYEVGDDKASQIEVYLSETFSPNTRITVGEYTYNIQSFSIVSGPIPLGKEVATGRGPASKRYLFSINGTVSLYQLNN